MYWYAKKCRFLHQSNQSNQSHFIQSISVHVVHNNKEQNTGMQKIIGVHMWPIVISQTVHSGTADAIKPSDKDM